MKKTIRVELNEDDTNKVIATLELYPPYIPSQFEKWTRFLFLIVNTIILGSLISLIMLYVSKETSLFDLVKSLLI